MVRLFAGRRADPFFANLQGFRQATSLIKARLASAPAVQFDPAGCPTNLTIAESASYFAALGAELPGQAPCAPAGRDCFIELNVKVILVQLDKSLVNMGKNTVVGVWASTHDAP
jgi:hypothetical protein